MPGNDIHVKTVADSIILTGSVASAGDAQKALDIASGFVGRRCWAARASGARPAAAGGSSASRRRHPVTGKVINSLIIRGLDQVSLRVTISEIRRDIIKQLGVNMTAPGSSGSTASTIDQSVRASTAR